MLTLTVAGVSLTFSIASMKEQSVELLQMQNNTVAESFKGSMDSYKEIVLGTIMDDSVQNYCRQVQKNELKTAGSYFLSTGMSGISAVSLQTRISFVIISLQRHSVSDAPVS